MAIDFPNSPTLNQIYTVGSRSWIWDGSTWNIYANVPNRYIQDAPPSSPQSGDQWFESDTGRLFVYYDSAWVEIGNATDIAGALQPGQITALSAVTSLTTDDVFPVIDNPSSATAANKITYGNLVTAMSSSLAPGLVYITGTTVTSGSSSSVSFTGCFSSTYDSYRIVVEGFQPSIAARGLMYRMRSGTTDNTSAVYATTATGRYLDGTDGSFQESGQTQGNLGMYNTDTTIPVSNTTFDIHAPNLATRTYLIGQTTLFNSQFGIRNFVSIHGTETSFDGITFLMNASGNITKVRIRIYGYRNS